MEIKATEYPWQWITMDHIVKLPRSNGCDAILVVVDRMTKYAHFVVTTDQMDAEGLADELMDEVFEHHGIPEIIVSDRRSTFALKLWRSMMDMNNDYPHRITHRMEQYLQNYVNNQQDNWAPLLSMTQLAIQLIQTLNDRGDTILRKPWKRTKTRTTKILTTDQRTSGTKNSRNEGTSLLPTDRNNQLKQTVSKARETSEGTRT